MSDPARSRRRPRRDDHLVGRDEELVALGGWLTGVRDGRSRPLVLEGEVGVGKTSLLRALLRSTGADELTTLHVTAIPTASALAFGGLTALVAMLTSVDGTVGPAAQELAADLADTDAPTNPLVLTGRLVGLLAEAAHERPLVVVVDDGHWLDAASAEVVRSAFGGLAGDRCGLVVAVRSGEGHAFDGEHRLVLEGLSLSAATTLFAALDVSAPVLASCWQATNGNPLALDAVLQGLDAAQRAGSRPLPAPLPVADAMAAAFRHRLDALAPATREALVVLAADVGMASGVLRAALATIGLDRHALEEAEDAGVVRSVDGRPTFAHPLLRAAALSTSTAAVRRAAHAALADAYGSAGERDAQAWQLAAAATGPDDDVAAALAAVATSAADRGATSTAAEAWLLAGRLSTVRADRAARLLAAADATWVVDRTGESLRIVDEALAASDTPKERAVAEMLLGRIELWERGPRVARDRFLTAADTDVDAGLVARLTAHAAATAMMSGDVAGSLASARRAAAAAPVGDLAAEVQTALVLGYLECHSSDPAGPARLEPIIGMAEGLVDTDDRDISGLLGLIGMCLTESERLVEAERFLGAVVRHARREGSSATSAMYAAILAETRWRTGDWLEAAHLASTDVVEGATMPVNRAWTVAFLGRLDAAAGRAESCRRRCADAVRSGDATGAGVALIWAGHAMGLLELGLGRWVEAARHLDRVAALTDALGRRQPSAVWWQGDHVEALVRAGRHRDAQLALDRLAAERGDGAAHWPACVAERGWGLLATDLDEALDHLATALDHALAVPAPFEAARTRLVRGELLMTAGRGEEGAADLREALACFDRLAAAAFADRTRQLLGEPLSARSNASLADLLTPAELRTALAVARGGTNRDVAAETFVSAKTVEYHLQNIFRKLNLRTRTELAIRVADAQADGGRRSEQPVPTGGVHG